MVSNQLTNEIGLPPSEIQHCTHPDLEKWMARWDVFESASIEGVLWKKYATATCFPRELNLNCNIERQVVVDGSFVVTTLDECDVPLEHLRELRESLSNAYPKHEMYQVNHTIVEDGGTWSQEHYGYKVYLVESAGYRNGIIMRFIRICAEETCGWQSHSREGFFSPSSSDTWLRMLRKERDNPLIEYLTP